MRSVLTTVILIVLSFSISVVLTQHLERARPAMPIGYEDDDLSFQASKMKGFLFGAEGLAADWYWMNSLQYMGNKITNSDRDRLDLNDMRDLDPRLLYPYLNTAVELDPQFIPAYSYGAIVLPAIDPEKAIELAKKGIENNPNEWRLYQYLGYIYWKQNKFSEAAATYEKGSQIAGAPAFLSMMAAAMQTRGGDRATARSMYQAMLEQADTDAARSAIDLRLREIDSLDELEAINAALAEIRSTSGRCPQSLTETTPLLRKVRRPEGRSFTVNNKGEIVDPTGFPYTLDVESCVARLSPDSGLPKN